MNDYSQKVPAAERTLRILELLVAHPEGLTSGEIEEALEISHSALFALLNTLKNLEYVEQEMPRRPYRAGPRLRALAGARSVDAGALTLAFYEETARHVPDETEALVVLDGAEALVLAEAPCPEPVRAVLPPGRRREAGASAAGQVLLAGLSSAALRRRLEEHPAELKDTLEEVRRQTAARQEAETLVTLAVPICPDGQQPEAALLLGVPAFRWTEERGAGLLQRLRETAARISHRLGAHTYQPYGAHPAPQLGASTGMEREELQRFLDGPWAARLACVRPDGSPHVVPVWYAWQEGTLFVAAWPGSQWAEYVRRNPDVALTIDEPWPPMRRVLVRGRAHPAQPDEAFYERLSARYLGAPARLAGQGPGGWQIFEIKPRTVVARKQESDG
ncbi:MAG: pyridoxamine 5'-phosphate oxidase family protein [Anaerolineales bacterium]